MEVLLIFAIKLLFIVSIWCDAKGDAIQDDMKKRNHWLDAVQIAALVLAFFPVAVIAYNTDLTLFGVLWQITRIGVISYILLRIGLFNWIYTKTRDLPLWYLGDRESPDSDKIFDRWIYKLSLMEKNSKIPVLTIIYFFSAGIGFFLI